MAKKNKDLFPRPKAGTTLPGGRGARPRAGIGRDAVKISIPGPHERISKRDAIALISERVKTPGDCLRTVTDKVRKRMDYAIKIRKLPDPGTSGFIFGELIGWAGGQRGWRQALDGLPAIIVGHTNIVSASATVSARALVLPGSLEACHAALLVADTRNAELESRIAGLEAEVLRLQPFESRRKKMSTAGKRGGRGNVL